MSTNDPLLSGLLAQRLLPLWYHECANTSVAVLEGLYAGGIRYVEYTNRGPAAPANFKALRATADGLDGLQLGIGTIKNDDQARQYLDLGADFLIAPSVNTGVGALAAAAGKPWIPGCMTPTEIADAENAGAQVVKIFPGNVLGPAFISAVRDLFPGLRFLVTGGVEAETANLEGWFRAGASGVGMGSKLLSKELMDNPDRDRIRDAAAQALALVQQIR
ncbi:bifunctional 4-hydroxy-2-oxoglutarate aldolase/2-dehydro-3-deoxy-phosphogluconate aldolase [Flaviaesturariibacter aridisoli]|nr:bifunctional 4-hydroxy-2-oxoglutarate aldolase/2-dehydro-3-deoxy-phosphogluconate aldolase [Flaviaesturariibacter aridisoli]